MSAKSLTAELVRARYRLELAKSALGSAERAVVIEQRRVDLLEAHQAAGLGHVFTPDPDPTVRAYDPLYMHMRMPVCRLCGADITSQAGRELCRGDQHRCQFQLPAGTVTLTAFRRYGRPELLCGQPGVFSPDYTAWRCTLGHTTTVDHVDDPEQCLPSCPCHTMVGNDARRR